MSLMAKPKKRVRDYQQENKYKARPEQIKKRVNRNAARRALMRKGLVKKGDGLQVAHANGNALDNRPSNWKVESKHKNESYPRVAGAHKKYSWS